MVGNFLKMTQLLEKLKIFKFFNIFRQFFVDTTSLHKMGLNTQH